MASLKHAAKRTLKKSWKRPSFGPIGSAFLEGEKILIDFQYSPERVSALKTVGGARFDKTKKIWTLPLSRLTELRARELFSSLRFYFDDEDISLSENERKKRREEAIVKINSNPFRVSKRDLLVSPVDIEVVWNSSRRLVILKPRHGSKAVKYLSRLGSLVRSQREGGYIVQAHRLNEILKDLRTQNLSFAVEEEGSVILSNSAELRAEILARDGATLDQFRQALLNPILTINPEDDSLIALQDWQPEHLQLFFPSLETFPERKQKSAELTHEDLTEVFERAGRAGLKLFAEESLSKFLKAVLPRVGEELQEERRKRRERNRSLEILPDIEISTEHFSSPEVGSRLFPHQRVAVQWLREMPRALLSDDMGLGKTLSVLTYFESLISDGEANLLFIVCPNSLKLNWLREAENWFPKRKFNIVPKSKEERRAFFRRLGYGSFKCDALIVNFESVRLEDVRTDLGGVLEKRKVVLCVDEAQRIKNPKSKSFRALVELSQHSQRRVLLSGTPIPRDLSDIWSQIYLLDDGERLGKNFFRWLSKVAELGNAYSEFAVRKYKPAEVKDTIERVQELLLRRRKEDVVQLPEKTFTTRSIELSGDQKKFYEEIRKELLVRVTSLSGATYLREIQSVLEEYLRAVQVGCNPRLVDETWQGEPAKFLECDEIVKEIVEERGENIVLWTNYLGNIRELVQRYERYGARPYSGEVSTEDRERFVKEFQNREIKILVAVPAAGGVGITLTAAQTAVYLDKTWNAEHYLQSVDRLHRIGQKGTVNIIFLSASKVDALISKNLRRKEQEMKVLLGDSVGEKEIRISKDELVEALR